MVIKWVILLTIPITGKSKVENQTTLKVIERNKIIDELLLQFFETDNEESLFGIEVTGYINGQYIGKNYYDIFLKIREEVESSDGVVIACFGSLKNFFVTGLSIDWSNGLKGYLMDELTLKDEQFSVYQPVNSWQYGDLCSYTDQKKYRENFLKENQEKILERNRILDEEAKKIDKKSGGSSSIKGFPK